MKRRDVKLYRKCFSQTKATPLKKKKKKVRVEPVEKINEPEIKPTAEEVRKQNMKCGFKRSSKNKSALIEPKIVLPPPEPEIPPEIDKESSEDEVKLVDTIKTLKKELKLTDCIGLHCMDD